MTATLDNSRCITQCSVCEASLPPLLLATGRGTLVWECRQCGAAYQGTLSRKPPPELRKALRPRQFFPENGPVREADRDVAEFARDLVSQDQELDRRHSPRNPILLPVPALPLDDDFFPVGECVTMITRDISATGVSLIHSRPVSGKMAVLLNIPSKGSTQFIVATVRSLSVGDYFEIAGYFIERI